MHIVKIKIHFPWTIDGVEIFPRPFSEGGYGIIPPTSFYMLFIIYRIFVLYYPID